MSSVAYPAQPSEPGWWATAWLMFLGWLIAALVLGGLYILAFSTGAIGTSAGGSEAGVINEWPFPDNGWWSIAANMATFFLALGVTTVAVGARLRTRFASVSDGRLLVVLLFTGGIPFVVPYRGGLVVGFVIALCVVRAWVVRDDFRYPRPFLIAVGSILLLTSASYGLLHPIWAAEATTVSAPQAKRNILLILHNAARTSVDVRGLKVEPGFQVVHELDRVRVAPRADALVTLETVGGVCGFFRARVRYRVLGLTLSEPVRFQVRGLPGC